MILNNIKVFKGEPEDQQRQQNDRFVVAVGVCLGSNNNSKTLEPELDVRRCGALQCASSRAWKAPLIINCPYPFKVLKMTRISSNPPISTWPNQQLRFRHDVIFSLGFHSTTDRSVPQQQQPRMDGVSAPCQVIRSCTRTWLTVDLYR